MPGGFKAQPVPGFIRKRKEQAKQSLRVLSTSIAKPDKKTKFHVGDVVGFTAGGKKRSGLLVFIGTTHFSEGEWCGIVLNEPAGKNDGSVLGVRYFECKNKHGIFLPIDKVKLVKKGPADEGGSQGRSISRSSSIVSVESNKEEPLSPVSTCSDSTSTKDQGSEEDMKTVVTRQIDLEGPKRPMTVKIGEGTRVNEDGTERSDCDDRKSMVVYITGHQTKKPTNPPQAYHRSSSFTHSRPVSKPSGRMKDGVGAADVKPTRRATTSDTSKAVPTINSLNRSRSVVISQPTITEDASRNSRPHITEKEAYACEKTSKDAALTRKISNKVTTQKVFPRKVSSSTSTVCIVQGSSTSIREKDRKGRSVSHSDAGVSSTEDIISQSVSNDVQAEAPVFDDLVEVSGRDAIPDNSGKSSLQANFEGPSVHDTMATEPTEVKRTEPKVSKAEEPPVAKAVERSVAKAVDPTIEREVERTVTEPENSITAKRTSSSSSEPADNLPIGHSGVTRFSMIEKTAQDVFLVDKRRKSSTELVIESVPSVNRKDSGSGREQRLGLARKGSSTQEQQNIPEEPCRDVTPGLTGKALPEKTQIAHKAPEVNSYPTIPYRPTEAQRDVAYSEQRNVSKHLSDHSQIDLQGAKEEPKEVTKDDGTVAKDTGNDELPRVSDDEWPGKGNVRRQKQLFDSLNKVIKTEDNIPGRDFWKQRSKSLDVMDSHVSHVAKPPKSSASLSNLNEVDEHATGITSPSTGRRRSLPVTKRKIVSAKLKRDSFRNSASLDGEHFIAVGDGKTRYPSLPELRRSYSDMELEALSEDLNSVAVENTPNLSLEEIHNVQGNTEDFRNPSEDLKELVEEIPVAETLEEGSESVVETLQQPVDANEDQKMEEAAENVAKVERKSGIPKKTGIPKMASRLPTMSVSSNLGKLTKGISSSDNELKRQGNVREEKTGRDGIVDDERMKDSESLLTPDDKGKEMLPSTSTEDLPSMPRYQRVGDIVAKIEKVKPRKAIQLVARKRKENDKGPNDSSMGNKNGSPYARSSQSHEELAAKEYLSQKYVDKHTGTKSQHGSNTNQNGSIFTSKPKAKSKEAKNKVGPPSKASAPKPVKAVRSPSIASDTSSYVSVHDQEKEREEEVARVHEKLKNQVNYLRNSLTSKHRTLEALAVVIQRYTDMVEHEKTEKASLFQTQLKIQEEMKSKDTELDETAKQVESLQDKLTSAQSRHSKDLEELRTTMRTQHDRHIDEVSSEYHEELEQLKENHIEEMQRMGASYHERLAKETKEILDQHSKDLETVVSDYEEKLEELKIHITSLAEERETLGKELSDLHKKRDSRSPYSVPESDLPAELESLQAVLEIKKDEIKELRQQNMEMKKKMEDFHELQREHEKVAHEKEALKMALENKSKFQRQISVERDNLAANLEEQSRKVMRLSMENEELLWKVAETNLSTSTPSLNNNCSPTKFNGSPRSPTSPLPKKLKRLSLNLPTLHDEFPYS